jgi:deoxyxylulose-5-phosphate synthase
MHTVKPIDKTLLNKIFKKYPNIAVLEEHASIGGLTSAISEYFIEKNFKNRFLKLNTGDKFILKSGNQNNAYKKLNISAEAIEKKIVKFLKNDN